MIRKQSTRGMSREEWINSRHASIGGSDAAAVLGLGAYNSAYALWAEKTGKMIPEDISDKEAVRLGNDLEQYVAERFMEATGKKVRRDNNIITNDQYPFAHANVDRLVVGENAGLECKTTSSWEIAQKLKSEEIPDQWYCQMTHYMMVTGAERWYLAALVFGVGFYHFTIERDEAEITALAMAEEEFWDRVEKRVAPPVDGLKATGEALKTIFRDSNPGSVADLTMVGHHIECYTELSRQIKDLEEQQAEHENAIKEFMGFSESGSYGDTKITWKTQSRRTFDKDSFEAANGKIADCYYKTSQTRTFRVSRKEKKTKC